MPSLPVPARCCWQSLLGAAESYWSQQSLWSSQELRPGSAYNLITHNQEFTVAIVTPQGMAANRPQVLERIDISRIDVDRVTGHVLRSLVEAGVTGKYQVDHLYRQGHGKRVLAIVVISEPVAGPVNLPEPSGGDVTYVQEPNGWRTIPSQVHTLDRHIRILPAGSEKDLASLMIDDVGGWGTGFAVPRPDH